MRTMLFQLCEFAQSNLYTVWCLLEFTYPIVSAYRAYRGPGIGFAQISVHLVTIKLEKKLFVRTWDPNAHHDVPLSVSKRIRTKRKLYNNNTHLRTMLFQLCEFAQSNLCTTVWCLLEFTQQIVSVYRAYRGPGIGFAQISVHLVTIKLEKKLFVRTWDPNAHHDVPLSVSKRIRTKGKLYNNNTHLRTMLFQLWEFSQSNLCTIVMMSFRIHIANCISV